MNAEAERQMRAGAGAVDDEVVGVFDALFVAIARDVPHHHPLALADLLAADFGIDQRGAPHMRQRRLPANNLRHHGVDQRRIVAKFSILVGMFVQRQHRTAHGIAGGVIAADDQQNEIAQEVARIHVPRRLAVRHHRQQIGLHWLSGALFPQLREIGTTFLQLLVARLLRRDHVAIAGSRGRDIGPAGQLAPLLPREVEQDRQHLRGELD